MTSSMGIMVDLDIFIDFTIEQRIYHEFCRRYFGNAPFGISKQEIDDRFLPAMEIRSSFPLV
jgi:hypothetical protein